MAEHDYIPDEDFDEVNASGDEAEEEEDAATDDGSYDDEEELRGVGEISSPDRREIARKEKERLRVIERQRAEQLEKFRKTQGQNAGMGEAERKHHRLNYLLKQAEVFQHFAGKAMEESTIKKKRGRGRHAGKDAEEAEDQELLQDEMEEGTAGVGRGHRLQVQPSVVKGGTMREYQIQGLNWLIHLYDNGINGILADEMGLGKTLQTISLLGYLNEFRGITGPHLVIVPKSTLHNWLNEFRKWCPCIRAMKFHGNAEERERLKKEHLQPGKFDACITSYEMVIKEKNHFKRFHFRYIIIDEAHRIKNENSILSRVVRMFKTNYRLLITGTPLQNNLHELWALLNFLLPEVFASAEKFEEWFGMGNGGKEKEAEVVQQLHKVLRPFLLRRVKSDVERGLPPKKETILKIGMSEMQKQWYKALLQKDIEALNGGADRTRLMNVVMQLRKCCNHPYLFTGAEPGPPYFAGEHLMENSGKMVLLDKLLPRLKERDSRVLIFSQMTRMLDILDDYCQYRGFQYCRIDGNTSGDDRENAIDVFNMEGSRKFVFLLSTRAGGLGINLATADVVILYDSDWNPQMDLQAMDRAHRIGQKKEVQVFRFCTENSVEEKVIEKAYKKLRLDALVIQQGRLSENKSKVGKDDLLSMVRYGAEMVFSSDACNITDADIEAILTKGERDTAALNQKMQEFSDNAMKFTVDGSMDPYDMMKDEDEPDRKDVLKEIKGLVAANWEDLGERRKRNKVGSYAENEFYRAAITSRKGERAGLPRLSKMPQLNDFQFFNTKRLKELYDKEHANEAHLHLIEQKKKALRDQGASVEQMEQELTPLREECPPKLTEEEEQERIDLQHDGFSNWSRRDFTAFCRACEKYGRKQITDIAKEIEGKAEEEVREYAEVFWERYSELNDSDRIIKNIERGEAKIQRQIDIMNAISKKLDRYKNPWLELKILYGANKGKAYTEEEDRFLVCMMHKLGYGSWDDLKAEIRKSWRFRFDWFFKSRTPAELSRRCETLIRLIEKENEDMEGGSRGGRGSGGRGGGSVGKKRKAGEANGSAGAAGMAVSGASGATGAVSSLEEPQAKRGK